MPEAKPSNQSTHKIMDGRPLSQQNAEVSTGKQLNYVGISCRFFLLEQCSKKEGRESAEERFEFKEVKCRS